MDEAAEERRQALFSSLHYLVLKIAEQLESMPDVTGQGGQLTFSPATTALVSQLGYKLLDSFLQDIRLYALHAKRKTVLKEDIFLAVNKNQSILQLLEHMTSELEDDKKKKREENKAKKKKNVAVDSTKKTMKKRKEGGADGDDDDDDDNDNDDDDGGNNDDNDDDNNNNTNDDHDVDIFAKLKKKKALAKKKTI